MFFITGMTNLIYEDTRFDSEEVKKHASRCFGYYSELKDAVEAVKENRLDIFETCYWYVVIEQIEEGIHATATEIQWFLYNRETDSYQEIATPKQAFCNHAIG